MESDNPFHIIKPLDEKYVNYYSDDVYWGFGIENETYLISETPSVKTGKNIKKDRHRERYSVNYNLNYKTDELTSYLNKIFDDSDQYEIPTYINSHSFTKCDINLEHATMYAKNTPENPKYNGKSLHFELQNYSEHFSQSYNKEFEYDGDSIEFITQNFYKTTITKSVDELIEYKKQFIMELNNFARDNKYLGQSTISYPTFNYGLVSFLTNRKNVTVFNNGTYHFNFTLPTETINGKIVDLEKFKNVHQNAILMIQWFEPFIVALYGSPDVFSFANEKYVAGSLRLAMSRYIGIGTYDADKMENGKILNVPRNEHDVYKNKSSWYNKIFKNTHYVWPETIGLDFNYAKHHNAGIEFRILDFFPDSCLEDLINFIVLLIDHSMRNKIEKKPSSSQLWNDFVFDVLKNGWLAKPSKEFIEEITSECKINILDDTVIGFLNKVIDHLHPQENTYMEKISPGSNKPVLTNINRYTFESNLAYYLPINNANCYKIKHLFASLKDGSDIRCKYFLETLGIREASSHEELYNMIIEKRKMIKPDIYLLTANLE